MIDEIESLQYDLKLKILSMINDLNIDTSMSFDYIVQQVDPLSFFDKNSINELEEPHFFW